MPRLENFNLSFIFNFDGCSFISKIFHLNLIYLNLNSSFEGIEPLESVINKTEHYGWMGGSYQGNFEFSTVKFRIDPASFPNSAF